MQVMKNLIKNLSGILALVISISSRCIAVFRFLCEKNYWYNL